MASSLDKQIDELYQLPPGQFTAARNDLAKGAAAADKAKVRALRKPSAPAWAVNQLYWKSRRTWEALVRAAERLRATHRSALQGHAVDLRQADAAHREALSHAVKETMALVSRAGQQPTAALKEAVVRTLQALPADIEPGRLDAPLAAAGFGVLEGMAPSRAKLALVERKAPAPRPESRARRATVDREAERRRVRDAREAAVEAKRQAHRARVEAERQRLEEKRRAVQAAQRVAQLTAAVERARGQEDDLRERLTRATRAREAAEKELDRAR